MNIAILHYHLNCGGVAQVIANHLTALDSCVPDGQRLRVAILHGGQDRGWPQDLGRRLRRIELRLCTVAGLGYDDRDIAEPGELARRIQEQLRQCRFDPAHTVLHIHNHSLGTNLSLPGALRILAGIGYPLLLQIHDFPEDFRPENYQRLRIAYGDEGLSESLYPQASHIHYAVLNRRDQAVLRRANLPEGRLHLLPNPVEAIDDMPCRRDARQRLFERFGVSPSQRLALYPVRGIRRKALGEMLLWSTLAGPRWVFGLTLAPLNPAEQGQYLCWKNLAEVLGLPCCFEIGGKNGLPLADNLAGADVVLTTSVAEGFGMAFLEPWLAGRPVVGRSLPEVTRDFEIAGLVFNRSYTSLRVPLTWLGRYEVLATLEQSYRGALHAYGRTPHDYDDLWRSLATKVEADTIDFADLDEILQQQVLHRLHRSAANRQKLLALNPVVASVLHSQPGDCDVTIVHNQGVICREYGLERIGRKLYGIYCRVLTCYEPHDHVASVRAEWILEQFLAPDRFRPLRVCDHCGSRSRDKEIPAKTRATILK
jgi:glycosyltransferase involved in cell wall biosynthesis